MVNKRVKNIALVSNTSWYVYNFRKGFIAELIQLGYTVYVIAPKDKFVTELSTLGCKFIELKKINNKGKNPFQDIYLTIELRHLFKVNKIDVGLFFTPKVNIYGSIATKFSETIGIATINGLGFVFTEGRSQLLQTLVKQMYRFAFSKIPAIFFQNTEDKEFFLQSKILSPKQKTYVVKGSGVNISEFYPKTHNKENTSPLTFLLSARLIKEKGINEYIDAAKIIKQHYPTTKFALLGVVANNPSAIPLSTISQLQSEGVIDYWGTSDNMNKTLDEVDIMVLPSYYREGVPRVVLEALSKGLPVITTDNVGCRETVENKKNGYLIPVKNTTALAEAIEKMINLPYEQRIEMGNYSRYKAISEFDEQFNHKQYIDVLTIMG